MYERKPFHSNLHILPYLKYVMYYIKKNDMAIALKINASLHYKVLYIKTIDNFLEVTRYGILTKIVLYICKLL